MNNIKKYNIFIFLTTISKSMIEIFIPIILFNKGLSYNYILLFFLFKYILLFIYSNLIKLLKIKTKILLWISSLFSIITYIFLYYFKFNLYYLILLSIFYALYLITYWIARHNIALSLIEEKMSTERSSLFMIISIIGVIPSSILGGYFINNNYFIFLIFIIMFINIISIFFIVDSDETNKKKKEKIIFPLKNKIFLFLEQFKFISIALFPLYIYESINSSYVYVGLINTIIATTSIISIFFLSKIMDKNKKDYLNISSILLGLSWVFKLIIQNKFTFILLTIFDGIFRYNLDTIVLRNLYCYGKEYNSTNYNVYIENIRNISRIIISLFIILLNIKINYVIILGIISLFISSFIKFDDGFYGYKKT